MNSILHGKPLPGRTLTMFEEFTLTNQASALDNTSNKLAQQSSLIAENQLLVKLVNSISQMVVVLNEHRQIVYSNHSFKKFCKVNNMHSQIGKRPGEILGCTNAFATKAGCGTSQFCKSCGAVNSILHAQNGIKSTRECKILTAKNEAYELRVTANPFNLEGEKFTIFSLIDISAEKRKESLERVFLHDILNSAGGISGLATILNEVSDPDDIKDIAETISNAANNLVEEIKIQREIYAAERGDLKPDFKSTESYFILQDLKNIYSKHELNSGKEIQIQHNIENTIFKTDSVLLKRVIGNMIKNAIEANTPNDKITLNTLVSEDYIRFSVHNKSYIPSEIQHHLFKRSYSTKGVGRGIGAYCMKLLGEQYLNGKVWFESDKISGTSFYIELHK